MNYYTASQKSFPLEIRQISAIVTITVRAYSIMKKITIVDEIIHCLETLAQTGADTSMSEDVLNDFLNDYPQRALASACSLNTPEWETLRAECASCMKCGLGRIRTDKVFADGNPHAELLFIGAAPAPNDMDLPPGGNADELLTRMISAMTFDRATETCLINVVKCRPPGNRNPVDEEIAACAPYLKRQIGLMKPKVIVLLGSIPLQALFKRRDIMNLRGHWLDYDGIPVMPTYHPAYLLRNNSAKKDAWADLQAVMAVFGRKPAPRG